MKQKLLTDIELDVHELKYLMDSFTKEPTPTLSELLKRSITRMQGRLEELQQEVDAVQVISPSAVEETAEEEDEVAGSEEDSPVIIQSLESVVVKEDEEGEAIVAEEKPVVIAAAAETAAEEEEAEAAAEESADQSAGAAGGAGRRGPDGPGGCHPPGRSVPADYGLRRPLFCGDGVQRGL